MEKEMFLEFDSISENESFARVVIGAFMASLDPTIDQLQDVQTAVSEAVTNAIIHGYQKQKGKIQMKASLRDGFLQVDIIDHGIGIEDIKKAMEPLYTTCPEEDRSGMGFSFMEAFMDGVEVESKLGAGTKIHLYKKVQAEKKILSCATI